MIAEFEPGPGDRRHRVKADSASISNTIGNVAHAAASGAGGST